MSQIFRIKSRWFFRYPPVSYSMERAGEAQKKYHDFGISMKRCNKSLAIFYPIY